MSSSSSSRSHRLSSQRSKKHKKHHHRCNSTEGSAADLLKSLRNNVTTGMEAIQKEIQVVSSIVTSLESTAGIRLKHEQSLVDAGHSSGQSPGTHQEVASVDYAQSSVNPPSWGERPTDELPNCEEAFFWIPEESDDDNEVKKISDTTAKVLRDSFLTAMSNDKRRGVKRKRPVPDSVFAKCLKLDPLIMSKLPKMAKDTDHCLARLQTLVMDAANPLVSVLESACKGLLTPKDPTDAAQQALRLLID